MEPCDHSEEILGAVYLVFMYLRTLFLPQFEEKIRSLNISSRSDYLYSSTAQSFSIDSHILS